MALNSLFQNAFPLETTAFHVIWRYKIKLRTFTTDSKWFKTIWTAGKRVENSGGTNDTRQYTATLFTVNILAKLKIKVHIYLHQNVTFIFRFQVMQQFSLNKIFSVCTLPHLSFFCCICICICKMLYRCRCLCLDFGAKYIYIYIYACKLGNQNLNTIAAPKNDSSTQRVKTRNLLFYLI